jgi:tetratricopeptide (TPR) repeat protein
MIAISTPFLSNPGLYPGRPLKTTTLDWNLTNSGKKGTFENPSMSKPLLGGIILASLGLALVFACAGSRLSDQVAFGIWAADRDLWDEAVFRWKKVLTQEPGSAAAHNNLAVAYEKKGLWEEARREYETALKLSPDNFWVKLNYENFRKNIESDEKENDDEAERGEKE